MNYNEVMEIIKKSMSIKEFAEHDFNNQVEGIGQIIEKVQKGGEGEGEEWYSIKYLPDHDLYIKVNGYYQSYDGVEFYNGWDCCDEVRPKEKTIIVYE